MSHRQTVVLLLACVTMLAVSGCGTSSSLGSNAQSGANDDSSLSNSAIASDGTRFTGKYAAEFRQAYDDTGNDLVKEILKDGKITKAEVSEFETGYAQCLADRGLKLDNHLDASWNVETIKIDENMSDDEANEAERYCDSKTGYNDLMSVYQTVTVNPDKLDENEFDGKIVECLKQHGLVDKSMTVKDYKQLMNDDNEYAKLTEKLDSKQQQQFDACSVNPLNLQ